MSVARTRKRKPGCDCRILAQNHGQSVGFFAGEQPALQISDFPGVPVSGREFRKRLGDQEVEMRLLAKEIGLVSGDGVDQVDHLLDVVTIAREEVVAVLRVRGQVQSCAIAA